MPSEWNAEHAATMGDVRLQFQASAVLGSSMHFTAAFNEKAAEAIAAALAHIEALERYRDRARELWPKCSSGHPIVEARQLDQVGHHCLVVDSRGVDALLAELESKHANE